MKYTRKFIVQIDFCKWSSPWPKVWVPMEIFADNEQGGFVNSNAYGFESVRASCTEKNDFKNSQFENLIFEFSKIVFEFFENKVFEKFLLFNLIFSKNFSFLGYLEQKLFDFFIFKGFPNIKSEFCIEPRVTPNTSDIQKPKSGLDSQPFKVPLCSIWARFEKIRHPALV